jgi:aryl-phospho-beta-D-glucosidase BglC (GH1 family)
LTSTELTASWDSGWNLGNSLDVPDGETAWGNPAATAPLFSAVAAAGFDVVRIPVTWSNYTGAAPDYVIDATFMARVAEVVDLVNAAGMDAIINIHHDGADEFDGPEWLSLNDENGDVTDANNQAVEARFVKVWTQIAMHFKDHGENLVFESMNEIHDEYDPPVQAYYDIINHLNQTFVDLVRSTGGKNATRHLVVPGYNTNVDYTVEGFVKPTDTLADHLILSIHYYDPYTYSITAETHTWGVASPGSDDFGQEAELIAQFEKLKTAFTTQGTPMIMGEYGAPNQDGYADYRRYYVEYVTKVATDNGVVPVYWDNGGTGSGADNFALIDRNTFQVTDQNVLDALMRAATSSYTVADIALPTP